MTTENDHASEELGTQVELDSSHYHNGTEIMIGTLDDEYLWIIGCHRRVFNQQAPPIATT